MRSMDVDSSSDCEDDDDPEQTENKKKKKKKKVVKVVAKKVLKRFDLNSRSTQIMSTYYKVWNNVFLNILALFSFLISFKDVETMTVSPLNLDFSEQATADVIYDIYLEDFKIKQQVKLFSLLFNHEYYCFFFKKQQSNSKPKLGKQEKNESSSKFILINQNQAVYKLYLIGIQTQLKLNNVFLTKKG